MFPGQDWGKRVTERCRVSGRKKVRLVQYQSSYSNLEKKKLVKTIKSCREIDKERWMIGIRAQKGIVNFQACSFSCVKGGRSTIRV